MSNPVPRACAEAVHDALGHGVVTDERAANVVRMVLAAFVEGEDYAKAITAAKAEGAAEEREKMRTFWKEHDVCRNCGRLKPIKSERRAGAEANVDAIESLNEAHPDYGLTQRLIEAVEQGTRTDEIREQAAILSELTRLRTALAAAERAGAERMGETLVGQLDMGTWAQITPAGESCIPGGSDTFAAGYAFALSLAKDEVLRIISALFPPPGAEVGRG